MVGKTAVQLVTETLLDFMKKKQDELEKGTVKGRRKDYIATEVSELIASVLEEPDHPFLWATYEIGNIPDRSEACGYQVVSVILVPLPSPNSKF